MSTPLTIEYPGPDYLAVVIRDGRRIASFLFEEDAKEFVRAVECHDELLRLLKSARKSGLITALGWQEYADRVIKKAEEVR